MSIKRIGQKANRIMNEVERERRSALLEMIRAIPEMADELQGEDKEIYEEYLDWEERAKIRKVEMKELEKVDYKRIEELYDAVPTLIIDMAPKEFGSLNLKELSDHIKMVKKTFHYKNLKEYPYSEFPDHYLMKKLNNEWWTNHLEKVVEFEQRVDSLIDEVWGEYKDYL